MKNDRVNGAKVVPINIEDVVISNINVIAHTSNNDFTQGIDFNLCHLFKADITKHSDIQ